VPFEVRAFDRAIEKHAEWAAPSSSSGVVAVPVPSARASHETASAPAPELSSETVPLPSGRVPRHTVCAFEIVSAIVIPF
jgi:hypothetical protein